MDTLIPEICRLLNDTLSPEKAVLASATDGLDRLSRFPHFPLSLLAVATGGDSQGLRLAAAAYLKNFVRSCMDDDPQSLELQRFRNQLAQALLQAEPAVLKVLVEVFRLIVVKNFVKENTWPELVPELTSVIQRSNLIIQDKNAQWSTLNALTVLQTILRPFQYFLNPKVRNESVPVQLEIIAQEILVPLQATFHDFVNKVTLSFQDPFQDQVQSKLEEIILIICKCMYFSVRSYMPSALGPILPSFCHDLFRILDSLSLDGASDDGSLLRLKIAKRGLIIFSALVTRHRKHVDRLIPSVVDCAFKIAKQSGNTCVMQNLDCISERIISLAFDVISYILESGPGWRVVSPHFSSLLDNAIFPALVLNQKDILEWDEDAEEYIRKNLPSDIDEISGWAEDLFTARKSAINLLSVIAMSKGPRIATATTKRKKADKSKGKQKESSIGELLVIPFLSKFPMPYHGDKASSKIVHNYYGVLMAYGGLPDFLRERNSEYTTTLVRNRVLPLYSSCPFVPYLVATANWIIGELASCLPQAMSSDVYDSLIKALTMPDINGINCYPVRASAAGAIIRLLENEYVPPDWLSVLEVVVNQIANGEKNESSFLFHLLGTAVEAGQNIISAHIPMLISSVVGAIVNHIPPIPDPWPQVVVERGFAALAAITKTWEASSAGEALEHDDRKWESAQAVIARTFATLLYQAWAVSVQSIDSADRSTSPPLSCLDDASTLLGLILKSATKKNEIEELKIPELLALWSDLISDWHGWEEMEDLAVFDCIQEAVNLQRRCDSTNFLLTRISSRVSPGVDQSIIEGVSAFVTKGIMAYPSATWRACSCVHELLHVPSFSFQMQCVKQSIITSFTQAAFSHFKDLRNKPTGLWKPLLLVISSCYILCPEIVEQVLDRDEDNGFMIVACGLAHVSSRSFDSGISSVSEIKLAVITLEKFVERLVAFPLEDGNKVLQDCLVSLMEAFLHLKEVEEKEAEESDSEVIDDEYSDEEISDNEDSEDDDQEETQEEFLDRYAKAADELSEVVAGDIEDGVQDLELGPVDEIDVREEVLSLIRRHHQVLLKGQVLSSGLIQQMLDAFPECTPLLQVH
ncbi:unnamed protein product [Musa acuminata subsp. malaccensis]|uniref:(wild Malaysian banana) hypothetical protein n=1 Tax=Musa acuminata subsp. malaccensis TaxID=214687 RepID=A0A8D7FF98_MUSAM|nr:unnamed protein product [Musa acuminata subsp. malaccensis]